MADQSLRSLVRRVAGAAAGREAAAQPDPELLRRFAADRDEAAFTALVARHGPLVHDVCRAVLGNDADAEDAFQATFLLLAREAGSVRRPGSLSAWLHGVAHRTALKARTRAARRRKHEARVPAKAATEPDDLSWAEVRRVLHEELTRLAETYRVVLVLCDLDGLAQERAAEALGLTPAAVKKRLERGRERLRTALVRRGLGPAAALALAVVPAAGVPRALAAATARAASLVMAGPLPAGAVSGSVLGLVNGGSRSMFSPKLSLVLLPAVALGLALGPAGGTGGPATLPASSAAADPPRAVADAPDGRGQPLAGAWRVRHVETNGKPLFTADDLADARVVFDGSRARVSGLRVLFVGDFSFALDPAKTPPAIDVTFLGGEMKAKTFEGIYLVRGDEARLCLRLEHPEHGRPAGFLTSSGTTLYTFILARDGGKDRQTGERNAGKESQPPQPGPVPARRGATAAEKPAPAGTCRVCGTVTSTEYAKAGGTVDRSIVYVVKAQDGERVGESRSKERAFAFNLPPGRYELQCTANGSKGATFKPTYKTVTVKDGDTELDVGAIDLPVTETTKLFGRPAPDLAGVAGWKNTDPVTLKGLRGKVVVLDFWSYSCSICLHHKPDLAKLADRYKDKGLAVLTVHDGSADSIEEVDRKVSDVVKKKAGHLPVALDGKGKKGVFGAYGIHAVPAVILIGPDGAVVRRFHHAGDPELEREVARLLNVAK